MVSGEQRDGLAAGMRHLRAEWGRWWRTEDLTDTHIAHRVLNDQYRTWQRQRQRNSAEVQQNISLLKDQQKQQTFAQMQQMQMQRTGRGRFYGGSYGASPMISYRMMQWASLQMRMGQAEFRHLEVTPSMLAIGYGHVRSRRHLAAACWLLGLAAAWVALWVLSALAGLLVTVAAATVFTVVAWAKGRNPVPHAAAGPETAVRPAYTARAHRAGRPGPGAVPDPGGGHQPPGGPRGRTPGLEKEGAKVSEVGVPESTAYGWRVPLVLESGTAAHLVGTLKFMATTLRVGESRVLAQRANPDDAAMMNLRVLTRDPFADPLPYPERPPLSCTITNPVSLGLSLEGETTPVVLGGQHVIIVADTGGGKTAMTQAIAEYVTACHDAVVVDIDPAKRGLKALAPMAVKTARTPRKPKRFSNRCSHGPGPASPRCPRHKTPGCPPGPDPPSSWSWTSSRS